MIKKQLIFWLIVAATLTLLFGSSFGSWSIALYFVSFLLPVVVCTSLFFNEVLTPKYLLQKRWFQFWLYFAYMLIISVYLEMMVMLGAFVILADYQYENLGGIAGDIYLMAIVLYLIVFVNGFGLLFSKLQQKDHQISDLEKDKRLNALQTISIKVNRKVVPVLLEELVYIESLSDYVKVHTIKGTHITKEKISNLERQLPDQFIRIHRSYLINRQFIDSFNREVVKVGQTQLPISRKYKSGVLALLD